MTGPLTTILTVVLTAIVLCTCLHAAVVVVIMSIRRGTPPEFEAKLPHVTWFRPLKRGVRDLRGKLDAFIEAILPGDQVILGVDPGSDAAGIAVDVARAAGRHVVVVECPPGAARNPKTSKLLQMAPFATHERWMIVDAEAIVNRRFIKLVLSDWIHKGCAVLTCGYRFSGSANWPQRLDAMSTVLTLWPGLEIVNAFGKLRFTLGSCTGVHRADLESIGGWPALADELAEDYWLGARLSELGREVAVSDVVMTLDSDPMSWSDYWRHQLRVAVTYRGAQPAGTAGMILTRGVTAALLCTLLHPVFGLVLLTLALLSRVALAEATANRRGFALVNPLGLILVSDVVETAAWVRGWFARSVWWGGKWRPVTWRGKLTG